MSTAITPHPHAHSTAGRILTAAGVLLTGLPLALGIGAALMALTSGRFGGAANSLTALWYMPMYASPLALLGAVLLLVAVRKDHGSMKPVVIATAVMVAGLVLSQALAVLTGVNVDADALTGTALTGFRAGMALLTLAFLVGDLALVVLGVRHWRLQR